MPIAESSLFNKSMALPMTETCQNKLGYEQHNNGSSRRRGGRQRLTRTKSLDLFQRLDAVVQAPQGLCVVWGSLHLEQEYRRSSVDAVCKRQHTVIHGEGPAEEIKDGYDGGGRRHALNKVALMRCNVVIFQSSSGEHGTIEEYFERLIKTTVDWLTNRKGRETIFWTVWTYFVVTI